MRVHMGANYQGYELGRALEEWLAAEGHEVIWHGADFLDQDDDYPLFCLRVGQAVIADEDAGADTRGVVVGGMGTGEVIAANKVNGARAVAAFDVAYVESARRHANANILVVPAERVDLATAKNLIAALLNGKFGYSLDDARRLVNTNEYENSKTIEGWQIEG